MIYIWIAIGYVFIMLVFIYAQKRYKTKLKHKLNQRPIPSFDEWFAKYYSKENVSESLIKDVLSIIAKEIGIDATQIYPNDRFDSELSISDKSKHFLIDDDVSNALELIFKKYLLKNIPPKLETVDELIRYLSKNK